LTFWVNRRLTDGVDRIIAAQRELERAREDLRRAVQEARSAGRTWAEIGAALGTTRQAAFKRFGRVIDPVHGRPITGAHVSLENITNLTERVFAHIASGDYASVDTLLHPDVRGELSEDLVMGTWRRVLAEAGALEGTSGTHVVLPGGEPIVDGEEVLGTVVGVTTLRFEAGELTGRVAVDPTARVVGILIVPPGQESLPF